MKIKILLLSLIFSLLITYPSLADTFENGVNAYNSRNYKTAEKLFRRSINQNTNKDVAKYYLAITLVKTNKYDEAKYLYKSIISTSSNRELVSLSIKGLNLLGEKYSNSYSSLTSAPVTKAILNVNTFGSVLIIDNVILNNQEKVSYIFDTGATYTTISKQLARKLKISTHNAQTMKIMTGSGYINATKVILDTIEVNGLEAHNIEVLIADLPIHSSKESGNIAGLLGLSFINNFKTTIDRANNKIILEKN